MNDNENKKKQKHQCQICNQGADRRCSRCQNVYYCCVDHQKKHWKTHNNECFPPGSTCTRCNQKIPFPPGICVIEHPQHLLEDRGSMFAGTSTSYSFACQACHESFTKSGDNHDADTLPITSGSAYCFRGKHTVKPLMEGDNKRNFHDLMVLTTKDGIQSKINSLNGNEACRFLVIKSSGSYDDSSKPLLNISLPYLEELQVQDVSMGKLVLTPETTPKLRKIYMKNATDADEPDFKIICPELRDMSIYYWGPGNWEWLSNLLEAATKLERFDSYKLRVGYLKFASNKLKSIRLHRAELLERIDLWAPVLVELDLQAAYDLSEIHFLKKHPLKNKLPKDFNFNEELEVNSLNACLGKQAVDSILAHPRFQGDESDFESDDYW